MKSEFFLQHPFHHDRMLCKANVHLERSLMYDCSQSGMKGNWLVQRHVTYPRISVQCPETLTWTESSYQQLGRGEILVWVKCVPCNQSIVTIDNKIPLAPMEVLAPVSAHAGHSAQPPSTLAEIFRHACLQSLFHQISPFSGQKMVNWGCRWDSPNIFFIGFLIILLL